MTVDDEDNSQQSPSEPPRVPSPTPPPPDLAMLDEVTGPFPDDPLEALASIITPPPRPVEEEELRPEDAIDPTPVPAAAQPSQPDIARPRFASQPDLGRPAFGSQPDIPRPAFGSQPEVPRPSFASQPELTRPASGSAPELDASGSDASVSAASKSAALLPDARASRRARARITLRIPDDDIPGSVSPQPPAAAVDADADKQIINPVAVVQAMRIIAIGEPGPPPEQSRHDVTSEPEAAALEEGDVQSAWSPGAASAPAVAEPPASEELEVEPEPDDEPAAPPVKTLPPVAPRVGTGEIAPLAPPMGFGPLPPVEPPRPRMASLPPVDVPTPSAPPVGAFGPLPPVEAPRPRMPSVPPVDHPAPSATPVVGFGPLPPVEPPRPRMASVPPVDLPTPSAPPVAAYGPLPPVEPPRPRMPSIPATDAAAPVPGLAEPSEAVELEDDELAPDSSQGREPEPATVRAPTSAATPQAPAVTPPKPTPSPPQAAPVVVSPEDVIAAVSPLPAPARAAAPAVTGPEPSEEVEAEEVEPEPPHPAPPPKPLVAAEAKPPPRKPAVADDGARRRVRPPWEEVFSDDFVRAFPRLTPKQVSAEATFVEESLGVQKGGVLLDLGCGAGQHAVELASRGYNVVGYDLSLTMLALAADEAQERSQKINFLQGDMREMAFEEMFDAVFCWATSFGFFDEEKNASVLRRVHRALRQSGMFLLDLANRDFVVPRLPTLNWFEGDGCVCIDDAQFDSITSRLRVKRTLMREDGKSREVEYTVRLYALHEIGKMLHEAGFKVVEVSGHPATAGAYFGAESPRMIILSERR